jgi:hypothetical protein
LLEPPPIFSRCIQDDANSWHLPEAGKDTWMCVRIGEGKGEAAPDGGQKER